MASMKSETSNDKIIPYHLLTISRSVAFSNGDSGEIIAQPATPCRPIASGPETVYSPGAPRPASGAADGGKDLVADLEPNLLPHQARSALACGLLPWGIRRSRKGISMSQQSFTPAEAEGLGGILSMDAKEHSRQHARQGKGSCSRHAP